jgi:uncharacterized protein (TIGR02444 family)
MSEPENPPPEAAEGSLWAFAVKLYSAPGVADACLGLQDRFGCDVNVLLFAAWMGAVRHCAITPAEMAETIALVRPWHAEIVRPLRDVRRRLKSAPLPAPRESSEALGTCIKAIELESERIELSVLEQFAERWPSALAARNGQSLGNLDTAVRHFTGEEPPNEALDLARAIERAIAKNRSQEP